MRWYSLMKYMVEDNRVRISVIMPVYNTPAIFLKASLDSILRQDFDNYEVICVDDCSKNEETITTLTQYNNNYDNLHVLTLKENAGAANARNIGFSEACGEYVIFLDADDLFGETLLSRLYDEIEKEDADICLFVYSLFEEKNGEIHITEGKTLNIDTNIVDNEMFVVSVPASGCNRLCKRKYLRDNKIEFQNLSSDNDTFFSLMTLLCAHKIAVVNEPSLFFYRFNTDFQISKNMNPLNLLAAIKKTKTELSAKRKQNYCRAIDVYMIVTGLMEMSRCKIENNAREFYNEIKLYLNKESVTFYDERISLYVRKWLEEEFDSKWFLQVGDYDKQIHLHTEELLEILCGKNNIVVWGHGVRGKAFIRWAKQNKISIAGICDKNDNKLSDNDSSGIRIVSCEEAKRQSGYIIASNNIIYDSLSDDIEKERILNLEIYCPL